MCNSYKQRNSFSCETYVTYKHFVVCNTYVGLNIFPCVTHIWLLLFKKRCLGMLYFTRDVTLLCLHGNRGYVLNYVYNSFHVQATRRLRVQNPVLFSALVSNADTCAVRGPSGSTLSLMQIQGMVIFCMIKHAAAWHDLCNYIYYFTTILYLIMENRTIRLDNKW